VVVPRVKESFVLFSSMSEHPQQDILESYHKLRLRNKKTFRKAKEFYETIGAVTGSRDLMDAYQLLYLTFSEEDKKAIAKICKEINDEARTKVPECFRETKPKKFDVVQPNTKTLDDFAKAKPILATFKAAMLETPEKYGANGVDIKVEDRISIGPFKDLMRSVQKISEDYDAKPERLLDFIRASAVCHNGKEIIKYLSGMRNDPRFTIVRAKNGFTDSAASGGYRDIKMNVLFEGHICELQVHHFGFLKIKNEKGHKIYEITRNFTIQGVLNAWDLITDKSAKMKECIDMLLSLAYQSELLKCKKDGRGENAVKALMDWLEYGDPDRDYADQLVKVSTELPDGTPTEKIYKKKVHAYAQYFRSFYADDDEEEEADGDDVKQAQKAKLNVDNLNNAVQELESVFGPNHGTCAIFRKYLVSELIEYDMIDDAIKVATEAVEKLTTAFGESNIETARTKLMLIWCCNAAGQYEKATKVGPEILPALEKFALESAQDEDEDDEEEEGGEEEKDDDAPPKEKEPTPKKVPPTEEIGRTHFLVGEAQKGLGKIDEAIESLRKCISINNALNASDYDVEDYEEETEENQEANEEDDVYDENEVVEFPVDEDTASACQMLFQLYESKEDYKHAVFFLNQYMSQLRRQDFEDTEETEEYKALEKLRESYNKKLGWD
jgi:tetratricopeptide (TPR) repeat protein